MAKHRRRRTVWSKKNPGARAQGRRPGGWSPVRRATPRALRFEPLEQRQLLAVGPQLIGVNPNNGEVLEDGEIRHLAPQELTFRFDENQIIDPATLGGIQIRSSGPDGVRGNGDDVIITPGFSGIGERPNEVVVRFTDSLPDDRYRITVFGAGPAPLRNTTGDPFQDGVNKSLDFELDLGAQIIAVVPQPTGRDVGGARTQARDQIVVYFNNDDLHPTAVTTGALATDPTVVDPQFYKLIFTNDTLTNTDDQVFTPTSVSYDPVADRAVLTFASDLAELPTGPGTYRLRIGTDEGLPEAPTTFMVGADPGSSFETAHALGVLTAQSQIIQSAIDPQSLPIEFPGSNDEPGQREIAEQDHLGSAADSGSGITTQYYNFRSDYGFDPLGNSLFNLISPGQKRLARQIFQIYGSYLGMQFIESDTRGLTIVTGDLRAINPTIDTGPGGVAGLAGGGLAVMDNAENWDETFGGSWFSTAFHEIGHLLGLGHTYELPPGTIMGSDGSLSRGQPVEPVFPGDHDIVHGRYMHRPDGIDIDLFSFEVQTRGVFTAETFAERLADSSTLDSVLSLYREVGDHFELISRNDDYFSEDSFVKMELTPGRYIVGVTSSGNREFDPTVEDTGLFGTTDGQYELRLDFRPIEAAVILDATGTSLDGDGDGAPGGVFNFWFRTQTPENTLFVDKSALGGSAADGSLAKPYRTVVAAFANAQFGDIVRIVGNGGTDGNLATQGDNFAYLFGFDQLGRPLEDGATIKVPRGVTVMVDAGAIFKAKDKTGVIDGQDALIEVGSSAAGIDRSGSALQVLGIPGMPVFFTSYNDEAIGRDTNPNVSQTPIAGDWGGIVFRNDLDRASPGRVDYEARGIFLNYVNHADVRYGGGRVAAATPGLILAPIQITDARPTITFNSVRYSSDAALSATPNSFEETNFHAPRYQTVAFTSDYDRVGPEIRGNRLFDNTINGLFIRIRTPAGDALQPLTVAGRFDDTDVVHILSENLVIQGTPGGPRLNEKTLALEARTDARLAIDPGTVVKLGAAYIQVDIGAQLIAEGLDGNRVILTSLADDTFGAGGNFDTTGDGAASSPAAGDWGGIYFGHTSTGSIDHALIRYGGGVTRLKSASAGFNVIEIHQADVRITNSVLEYNARGTGGQAPGDRFGLLSNAAATIFVRGAQPVIVDNIIRKNAGPAINVNVNALNHFILTDFGRSTGSADEIEDFADNQGPLVRRNRLLDNGINGMLVRGGTLTTQSVWDDTDIVHVLQDEVIVPDFHTFGGLRLESSPNESLVVKLSGARAGFTAAGQPLDIDDRIGGMVHIIGQPGSPVVLTSLADDTVGAGVLPDGTENTDTNNDGTASQPAPGDWRSILLEAYSHDRNVAVYTEREAPDLDSASGNATPEAAEFLGALAPHEKGSDDNLRLGFEIHGFLSQPGDRDVFSFQADAGTEVWLDIDRTSQALDTVVELIDGNGNIIARSDNSIDEGPGSFLLVGSGMPMQKLPPFGGQDFFATNPKDAGMRVTLPDAVDTNNVYHVRVRSSSDNLSDLGGGETSGVYQLQIRLHEIDEFAGSNVRFADVRYATNGIEILGQPTHSPLLGEAAEDDTTNDTQADAQDIGNFLQTDRGALSVAGILGPGTADVDFYRFEVYYEAIQRLPGSTPKYVGTIFDVDYADGLARGNINLTVFDAQGRLILTARDSNVADDRPIGVESNLDDLSRGSLGPLDPFLGTVELEEGEYFVAVSPGSQIAQELEQFLQRSPVNPLVRLEPIDSLIRIAEDHIGYSGGATAVDPVVPVLIDQTNVVPYFLGDMDLFVTRDTGGNKSQLLAVDPFTGVVELVYGEFGRDVGDIAMRYGGRLNADLQAFTLAVDDNNGPTDGRSGNLIQIDTSNGSSTQLGDDGIVTYQADANTPPNAVARDTGIQFEAMTFIRAGNEDRILAIGNAFGNPPGVQVTENILYYFNSDGTARDNDGNAKLAGAATDALERGEIITTTRIQAVPGDILPDGATFTVEGVSFEFDSGPAADVDFDMNDPNQRVVDGEFFVLDGQTFEFDTDSALNDPTAIAIPIVDDMTPQEIRDATVLAVDGAMLPGTSLGVLPSLLVPPAGGNPTAGGVDAGDQFVINDNMGSGDVVFQFTKAGLPGTGDVNIDISDLSTQDEIANLIVTAIQAAGLGLAPVNLGGGEVLLAGAALHTFDASDSVTLAYGIVDASTLGIRVGFSGATTADFTGVNDFTNVGAVGGTLNPIAIPMPFLVDDLGVDIAQRIEIAINTNVPAPVVATALGTVVTILDATGPATATGPLVASGDGGPGGMITGMTVLNGTVYAVSDAGGLWQILSPLSGSPYADFVATSAADLDGINFAGLTAGPSSVEGGLYSNMLFAVSEGGVNPVTLQYEPAALYAFDPTGLLQPIFLDGATSVELVLPAGGGGMGGQSAVDIQGLAFSSLQQNLWHITGRRRGDAGHGVNQAFDGSRGGTQGGSSFFFGRDYTNPDLADYNTPAGAHGVIVSNPFDLSEYSATDQPVLYFNYFAITQNVDYDPTDHQMRDAFRVYISDGSGLDGSGQWHLLATNDTFRSNQYLDEYDDPTTMFDSIDVDVQELYDFSDPQSGTWRQVRIPLDEFAGRTDVRLRFEFSTAASFNFGDTFNTDRGELRSDLRTVPGSDLRDGDTFTIDLYTGLFTRDLFTFEFDSGYTLDMPGGAAIAEGDTIGIDGPTSRTYFEYDSDGIVDWAVFVPPASSFGDGHTFSVTDGVATELFELNSGYSILVPAAGGNPMSGGVDAGDEFVINDNDGSGDVVFQFTKNGLPGTGDVNIEISDLSTQDEIAELIVTAIERAGLHLTPVNVAGGRVVVGGVSQTFDVSGPLNLGSNYSFLVPAAGGDATLGGLDAGDQFMINDNAGSGDVVFEFTKNGLPGTGDVNIEITDASTQDEIAGLIVAAVENAGLQLMPLNMGSGKILIGGVTHTLNTSGSLGQARRYTIQVPSGGAAHTLETSGPLSRARGYGIRVPAGGGDPALGGIEAGDQFVINDNAGSGDLIFQFTKGGLPGTGDFNIEITDANTQDEIAEAIVTAIQNAGLGLAPINLGGGDVLVGGITHTLDTSGPLNQARDYSLYVPVAGGDPLSGGVDAGDQFVINDNAGSGDVVFQFTKNGLPGTGDFNIAISDLSTQNEIAQAIVTAIGNAGLGLTPVNLGGGGVLVGGTTHTLTTAGPLNQGRGYSIFVPASGGDPLSGGVGAGDEFVINDSAGSGDVVFQFTKGGLPGTGDVNIEIADASTQNEIAQAIVTAIGSAALGLSPVNLGGGRVFVGGVTHTLEASGSVELGGGYSVQVPASGGDPALGGVDAGDQFVVNNNAGSGDVVFQFTKGGLPGTGDVNIEITEASTQDEIAEAIVTAIGSTALGLTAANLGGGKVLVGGIAPLFEGLDAGDQIVINDNVGSGNVVFQFTKIELPGTGDVNIEISDLSTQEEISEAIVTAIGGAGLGLAPVDLGGGQIIVGGTTHTFSGPRALKQGRGYSILVPGSGGDPALGGVEAGDQFVINDSAGSGDVVFQFTKGGLPGTGDVNIEISDASTQDEIAEAIVAAVGNSGLGMAPIHLGGGDVFIGGLAHTFDAPDPLSPWSGVSIHLPASDGDHTLETSGALSLGRGHGLLLPASDGDATVETSGALAQGRGYGFLVPAGGGDPALGGIEAGDQFVINDNAGSGDVVFQFTKGGLPGTGDVNIEISDASTQDEIAEAMVTAIGSAGVGLAPVNLGGGEVLVGGGVTYTFDLSGSLTLGRGFSVLVPAGGGDPLSGGLEAGDEFVVNDNAGSGDVVFQLTKGGLPGTGDFNIEITDASTQDEIAEAIVTAIQNAGLGLTPVNLGGGEVLIDGVHPFSDGIEAGDQFVIQDNSGSGEVVFQFTQNGLPGSGDVNVEISDLNTRDEIAELIVAAIESTGLGLTPANLGSGAVLVGGGVTHTLAASGLLTLGRGFSVLVPAGGGDPASGGVKAGDQFVVKDNAGGGDVVFQFTKGGLPGTGDFNIEISNASTQDEIAEAIVTAVQNAGLGLTPVNLGGGQVLIDGVNPLSEHVDAGDALVINDNAGSGDVVFQFTKIGLPGTGDFNIEISDLLTRDEVADRIVAAIEYAGLGLAPVNLGGGKVLVGGITHTLDTSGSPSLGQDGLPGTQTDGTAIQFVPSAAVSGADMAAKIAQAINGAGLNLTASAPDFELVIDGAGAALIPGTSPLQPVDHTPVALRPDAASAEVAGQLALVIGGSGALGVVPHVNGNRLNLENAVAVSVTPGSNIGIDGQPGVQGVANTPVTIHEEMTSVEVADAIAEAMAATFAGFNQQIIARDGTQLAEGATITVASGTDTLTIEFDSGYTLTSPPGGGADITDGQSFTITNVVAGTNHSLDTSGSANLGSGYTILVPASGGNHLLGGINAGDEFVINDSAGSGDVVFQFTKSGFPGTGDVNIEISDASTQNEVADLIATAIGNAGLGLTPLNLGSGRVLVGGVAHTLDASASLPVGSGYRILVPAAGGDHFLGGIQAGDELIINPGTGSADVVVQFTKNGLPGTGDVNIQISDFSTQNEIADLIVAAIKNASLGLTAVNLGGDVLVGGISHTLSTSGALGLGRGYNLRVPLAGGDPASGGIAAGDQFVVNDGTGGGDFVFQFTKGGLPGTGDVNIGISDASTRKQIADLMVAAIKNAGLGLTAANLGSGNVFVSSVTHSLDTSGAENLGRGHSILVPLGGGDPSLGGVDAGDEFVVNDNAGSGDVVFQFTKNGLPGTGDVNIEISNTSTQDEIADLIVAAIEGAGLQLAPVNVGFGRVVLGGTSVTFEFDKDLLSDPRNTVITIDDATTAEELGVLVADAITAANLSLTAVHLGNGVVHVGGTVDDQLVNNSDLVLSGQPGAQTAGATPLVFTPRRAFTADQTAAALETIINSSGLGITATADGHRVNLVGEDITVDTGATTFTVVDAPAASVKRYGDTLQIIGHTVVDEGKLGLADNLWGDQFGAFNSTQRAQDNGFEGIFIDDLIIGFAGRGEMATASTQNTTFRADPLFPSNQVLEGPYQLEIRRAADYGIGDPLPIPTLLLLDSFDINDRLTEGASLVAPSGAEIAGGQTFTLGDGLDEVTFVFQDFSASNVAENGDVISLAVETTLTPGASGTYSARAGVGDGLDVDFFAFDLAAGDSITIDIDARVQGSPLDSVLRLFDASGVQLWYSDDDPAPGETPGTDSFIDFTALTAGRYFVGVSGYSNRWYDPFVAESGFGWNSTGSYEIEFQLNGGQPETGIIIPFSRDDTPAEIANRIAAAINRDDVQERLDVQAASNPYGARVELWGSLALLGGFSGSLSLPEPNNTLSEAIDSGIVPGGGGSFRADGAIGDSIVVLFPGLDVDLIKVELGAGETISVDIDAYDQGSSLDSVLRLFDADGMQLALSDDAPAPGETFTLDSYLEFTPLEAGTYFIGVSGFANFSYDPNVAGKGSVGSTGFYHIEISRGVFAAAEIEVIFHDQIGDTNIRRDQGQLLIESNFITDSAEWGILVDAGPRVATTDSPQPHQGPVRVLGNLNNERLVPAATIVNNVIAFSGTGGIRFSGDTNPANGQNAPVPYGRILNNTVYGTGTGDVGIQVDENASPTVLNNIMARLETGLDVDASSQGSVLGGLLFQDNVTNSTAGLGDNPIVLTSGEPLFVNPGAGNFYLDIGSKAIDSAIKSLEDRPELIRVREPLGIKKSPVLAPEFDVFGLFRADDPDVKTPPGLGESVFLDRGAIDRVDFDGPLVELITPPDGDGDTYVQSNRSLREFVIQINDGGVGVADGTVGGSTVIIQRNGVVLVRGQDYTFRYDATNNQIRLAAGSGVWARGTYRIVLDNSVATGIKDMANNPLEANQQGGTTEFTIQLGGGADYGDAPDPSFPTLLPAGAKHNLVDGFFLGYGVDADANGKPSAGADADGFDDGVSFDTPVALAGASQVTIRASALGKLDAWIDYDRNGVWEAAEQIFASQPLAAGLNVLTFDVPAGANPVGGTSFARFRFSTAGGLAPGGAASDGEVEDYQVQLETARWQNPNNSLDVNGDTVVSAQDVLFLANFLYFHGQKPVPDGPGAPPFPVAPPPYYDVNGDNWVTVIDGRLVAEALRNRVAPEGEGEQLSAAAASSALRFTETVAPPVTVDGVPSAYGPTAAVDAGFAAGSTILGGPVRLPSAGSSDRDALLELFLQEAAAPSVSFGGIPGIDSRDLPNEAVAPSGTKTANVGTEPTVPSSNGVAAAVDQIMARSLFADHMGLVDGMERVHTRFSAATADARSDVLDDFFAQLEEVEQLEELGVGPARRRTNR